MVDPVPEEELLTDLQQVYSELGEPPSESQYDEHGRYSSSAVRGRFGKFTAGREAAGIPNPDKRGGQNKLGREELLEAIHDLADELNRDPTSADMREQGRHGTKAYRRKFGSWTAAIREAGYEPYRPASDAAERVDVDCANCGTTETRLKSQIKGQKAVFCSQDCLFEYRTDERSGENHPLYDRVEVECEACGSILKRKPSVVEKKQTFFCDYDCLGTWASDFRTGEHHPRWKGGRATYYGPNWHSQRRKRLEEDEFTCQWCGMDNAEHNRIYDRELDVHHKTPIRIYKEETSEDESMPWDEINALENLVTLCIPCHRKIEKFPVSPQFFDTD